MGGITCKFGGTSLADSGCVRRVRDIIQSNPARRYIVPSAPGKRTPHDIKITDLLLAWYNLARQGLDASQPAGLVRARLSELAKGLGVDFDTERHLDTIARKAQDVEGPDYMASRGEYLNGLLLAKYLDAVFVDPADAIKFNAEGGLDPKTYDVLGKKLEGPGLFIIPGFYGCLPDGRIKTFPRGGSDITGAIVARASGSELYENWSDVSGLRMADPRIVPHAKRIEEITYQELRELSYMGAHILHDEAIDPVRGPGIPIQIRNTNDPQNPGTLIVPHRETKGPVCGIAGRAGFTMINIEKTFMNKERGFGRRVLTVLDEYGVNFEHMPTGIDTISLIIKDEELGAHGPAIVERIERTCQPDRIGLAPGLAIIATVGQGMVRHIGIAARLCTALAKANINLRVIDQGSSEINIIIGVEAQDLDKAVHAIYDEFAD